MWRCTRTGGERRRAEAGSSSWGNVGKLYRPGIGNDGDGGRGKAGVGKIEVGSPASSSRYTYTYSGKRKGLATYCGPASKSVYTTRNEQAKNDERRIERRALRLCVGLGRKTVLRSGVTVFVIVACAVSVQCSPRVGV